MLLTSSRYLLQDVCMYHMCVYTFMYYVLPMNVLVKCVHTSMYVLHFMHNICTVYTIFVDTSQLLLPPSTFGFQQYNISSNICITHTPIRGTYTNAKLPTLYHSVNNPARPGRAPFPAFAAIPKVL